MTLTRDVKISANGRLVLPQAMREALGIKGESRLKLSLEDGEVRLMPMSRSLARAQELYRLHAIHDKSSDDFLRERRLDDPDDD